MLGGLYVARPLFFLKPFLPLFLLIDDEHANVLLLLL